MGIMLHFNNSETLSYSELLQHTSLPDKELTKQLQSLVETKMIDTEVRWNSFLNVLDIITTSVVEYVNSSRFYLPTPSMYGKMLLTLANQILNMELHFFISCNSKMYWNSKDH